MRAPGFSRLLRLFPLVVPACLPAPAAAETSASFEVRARIVPGCEVNGSGVAAGTSLGQFGTLDFGTHSALSGDVVTAALLSTGGLGLRCTPGVSLTMRIDGGLHADATRNLAPAGGGAELPYRLYADAAYSSEIGINQPRALSFGEHADVALALHARLVLPGNVPADSYADTLTVTLSW